MSENEVKITVRPNGPYRVEGLCKLVDADGKEWDLDRQAGILAMSLWRIYEEAVLRRNPLKDWISGCGECRRRSRRTETIVGVSSGGSL